MTRQRITAGGICFSASDKPFIRLQMPIEPETPIVNFDPKVDWPK